MTTTLRTPNPTAAPARGGYVIFAVLIVVVVLALVAYRFTDSMTAEYRASSRASDEAQARAAAASGLHYAAAVLSDRATFASELEGNPFDNPAIFEQFEVEASDAGGKKAFFSVRRVDRSDGGAEQLFGVTDEGGKLNINSMIQFDPTGEALYNALLQLPNMTPDAADAIVDWVDADDTKRANGAESSEYGSLPNPYKAKNGPLNSLDELLLVQGVTPELLYGGDRNRNGVLDEGETGSDGGWADYLTVYGRELNVDSTGQVRTYLNLDDLTVLSQQLTGSLGDEMATYLMACKLFTVTQTDDQGNVPTTLTGTFTTGQNGAISITLANQTPQKATRAATLDELKTAVKAKLETTFTGGKRIRSTVDVVNSRIALPRPADAKDDDPDILAYSPLVKADAATRGSLLGQLLDKTTVKQAVELVPRINVNTAPFEVLTALTGVLDRSGNPILTASDVDTILAARADLSPLDPNTTSGAWLITAAGLTTAKYKAIEKYVTGSTMVYRVQSVGYLANGGPVARMEAVIDTNQGAPRFLYVRDLAELDSPRGFEPPKAGN